jgi:hypothetical protein
VTAGHSRNVWWCVRRRGGNTRVSARASRRKNVLLWFMAASPGGKRLGQRRKKSTRWMPRRERPMKDVPTRRNALGRRWEPVIQRSPNGATPCRNAGPTASCGGGNRGN